jgi:hypothetical protein
MRARALAAILAGSIVVAACGSHAATKQDVIARGNAICAGALRDIRALPAPAGGATSPSALSAYLQQAIPLIDKEIAGIRALPRPARDRSLLVRYEAALTAGEHGYRALSAAARAGDATAVADALATLRANSAETLAAQYGLTQCASAAGTGVS